MTFTARSISVHLNKVLRKKVSVRTGEYWDGVRYQPCMFVFGPSEAVKVLQETYTVIPMEGRIAVIPKGK